MFNAGDFIQAIQGNVSTVSIHQITESYHDIRYIGITDNPDRRLEEHSGGRCSNNPKRE